MKDNGAKYRADARRFKRKYLLLKQEYEALKAGQEPKTDILDKIRAEIQAESLGKWYTGRVDGKTDEVVLMDDVMAIIDKYRQEG